MFSPNWQLWPPNEKWLRLVLLIPALICLLILIFSFTSSPKIFNPESKNNDMVPGTRKTMPKTLKKYDEMQGFTLTTYQDSKILASVKAESYSVEDKKVGVFRMGLLKEARIKNLELNLFNYSRLIRDVNDLATDSRNPANEGLTQPMASPSNTWISFQTGQISNPWDNTLSAGIGQGADEKLGLYLGEEIKALFSQVLNKRTSGSKIYSWVIDNFVMNLYAHDKTLLSSVRSNSAVMGGTSETIKLRGNFTISAKNGRTLTADHAVYQIHRNVFQVSAPYSLEPGGRKEVRILEVDAFLEEFSTVN